MDNFYEKLNEKCDVRFPYPNEHDWEWCAGELLNIIHRYMNEVNYKDYEPHEFEKYLANFTEDWLIDIINTRHYYEVWYLGIHGKSNQC